jgi:hypothetical protein
MLIKVIFLVLCSIPSLLLADEPLALDLKKAGLAGIIDVPAGVSSATPVDFYLVTKGNISSQIGVEAQGPAGITAIVEAVQLKGSLSSSLNSGRFWKIEVGDRNSGRKVRASVPATRAAQNPCATLSAEDIQRILAAMQASTGQIITEAQLCSGGSGSGSSSSEIDLPPGFDQTPVTSQIDQSYGAAVGVVQKDACSKINSYVVRIRVSLAKVDPAVLAAGFKVAARIQESEYPGGKIASLKPVSDGRFAPRPLLLMQSLGGSQWVNLVSWKNGKPRILKKVAASSYPAYWRGYVLSRIVADTLLSGGRGEKANFELTNGSSIYNVCGKRARVRWRANGYPG